MFLGLDISTSITGYTIIDKTGTVLECEHIDLKTCDNLFEKATKVKKQLTKLFQQYPIESVSIEESLQMFAMGKSSSKVLSILSKFNGIVSWIIYENFCQNITYFPAVTARKMVGFNVIKGKKGKDVVMDFLLDAVRLNKAPWFVPQYGRTGKLKPFCFDRADSWVISQAGFLKWKKTQSLNS